MQDHQPTSDTDADPTAVAAPETRPELAAQVLAVPEFDPDAFEQAAAQFRPSWERVAESEPAAAEAPVAAAAERPTNGVSTRRVSPAPGLAAPAGTGELEGPVAALVVPRAPRTPNIDYGQLAPDEEDDLGLRAAGLPRPSTRMWWIAAAALGLVAVVGVALMGGSDDSPAATTAPAAPARVEAVAAPAAPAPPAPIAPSEPRAATPVPVAEPLDATPVPAPAVAAPAPAVTSRSNKRAARPARAKPAAPEPRAAARPTTPVRGGKTKRGAGFVSTNPY